MTDVLIIRKIKQSEKVPLYLRSFRFSLISSSRSFIVLNFVFRSMLRLRFVL